MKLLRSAASLLLTMLSISSFSQTSVTVKRSGHIDPAQIFKLHYVPVEVPEGITEIQVKETYSNKGKNVLNMGIYGPEGYNVGSSAGFRGWSGGAKTDIFINAADASTGYIPGKIRAGVWNILIYPSTMIAEGLDRTLEVTLIKGPDKTPFVIKPAKEVVNNTAGWYSGDLHMHTLHSDGKRTQQELVDEAVDKKLDLIISTEHNTNSANLKWGYHDKKDLLIINGEEVTTTEFGHWNAIGLSAGTLIEWRYTPDDNIVGKAVDKVHADGGLAIMNHPFYTPTVTNGFKFDPALFDGIEVWNGNWDLLDEKALTWWDDLLKKGLHLLAIGASDTHKATGSENNLGSPRTVIYAKGLSRKAIISGLKACQAYICASAGMSLDLKADNGNTTVSIGEKLSVKEGQAISLKLHIAPIPGASITIIGSEGTIASEKADKKEYNWAIEGSSVKYARVEILDTDGKMLAMTDPIWFGN